MGGRRFNCEGIAVGLDGNFQHIFFLFSLKMSSNIAYNNFCIIICRHDMIFFMNMSPLIIIQGNFVQTSNRRFVRELRSVWTSTCQHTVVKCPSIYLQICFKKHWNDMICSINNSMDVLISVQGNCVSNGRRFVRELRLVWMVTCHHIFFLLSLKMHVNIA